MNSSVRLEDMIVNKVVEAVSKAISNVKLQQPDEYYTPDQLADLLQVDPETIRRMCRSGEIKYMKVGKLLRIPSRYFDDFCKSNLIV